MSGAGGRTRTGTGLPPSRSTRIPQGGVETRYVYDGDSVVQEYVFDDGESEWVLAGEYAHGVGVDNGNASRCLRRSLRLRRVRRHHDAAHGYWYYYHKDGLGSVTELTDSLGELVQAYEYDAGNASRCLGRSRQAFGLLRFVNAARFPGRRHPDDLRSRRDDAEPEPGHRSGHADRQPLPVHRPRMGRRQHYLLLGTKLRCVV